MRQAKPRIIAKRRFAGATVPALPLRRRVGLLRFPALWNEMALPWRKLLAVVRAGVALAFAA